MQHAVDHAKTDVIAHGGVSVTDVTWVMVITWSHMTPRMYYDTSIDRVSWAVSVLIVMMIMFLHNAHVTFFVPEFRKADI